MGKEYPDALSADGTANYGSPGLGTPLQLQSALTSLIAEGTDTSGLLAALAHVMSCAAILEDIRLTRLDACLDRLSDKAALLEPYISLKTSSDYTKAAAFGRQRTAVMRFTDAFPGVTVYRAVAPISSGGEQLGLLSLLRTDRLFGADEMTALGHAAGLFAVHLMQHKRMVEMELRLKGNFVDDLVSLRYSDQESILNRSWALNFDPTQPHRVAVGNIDNMVQLMSHLKTDASEMIKFRTELVGAIQSRLDNDGGGMVTYHNDEIVMLVRQTNTDSPIGPVRALTQEIIDEAAELYKAKLYIGIGSVCRELSDYQASYLEAKKALEIGAFMLTEGQVRSFEQFKIHALFLSTLKPAALYDYARSQLGPLLDYDALHETEFLKTLQEFLYLRNNIEKTAKSLSMSVSGLKYRLQKIEQILALNLKDYKICFDLQLALIILQLFGEYRIR